MQIFSGSSNKPLAEKVASSLGLSLGSLEITVFPDNENRVRVIDKVLDEDVVVIQSTGVLPNLYYMELFFILDSLKRSGARSVTLAIPYMGYQRQDHIFRDGEAVSLEVIIKLLESLGVDKVISFDLHSIKIAELFLTPISHLSALSKFAEEIKKIEGEVVLVSPDMGGIRRVEQVSQMLGGTPFVSIEKDRDLETGDVESSKINGEVKETAVIIDDVISTGKTLVSAIDLLNKNGVSKIYVFATHGIFSGTASKDLQNSKAHKIFVTDTIDISEDKKCEKLEVISIADLISGNL